MSFRIFMDIYIFWLKKFKTNGKKIYSINESNFENWFDDMKQYILQYKVKNTKYTQRYIGSMVADVHRTLLYGGVFCYPADNTNQNGKLRLMYECGPMAKIIEEAGGKSIVGNKSTERILNITPTEIHQKIPIILGSIAEVEKYKPMNAWIQCAMPPNAHKINKYKQWM